MTPVVFFAGNFVSHTQRTRAMCEDVALGLVSAGWAVVRPPAGSGRITRSLGMVAGAWLNRRRYQIGYVDLYSGPAFLRAEAVCAVMRLARKPYALAMRGGNLPAFARQHPARVRRLLRTATVVVAPSGYLQEQMQSYRDDIQLVGNGIDLAAYRFEERRAPRPRLVWLRAFHEIYNPLLAVDTLAAVRRDFPAARLLMVGPDTGDGTLAAVRARIAVLDLSSHVVIELGVDKADVPQRMACGDIFLNTANIDNLPVTVLEAMACGLCTVSTEVGGIPYVFRNGSDVLLVPPADPDRMAAAVLRILTEDGLASRLSTAARETSERFAFQAIVSEWHKLLSGLLEGEQE